VGPHGRLSRKAALRALQGQAQLPNRSVVTSPAKHLPWPMPVAVEQSRPLVEPRLSGFSRLAGEGAATRGSRGNSGQHEVCGCVRFA
jgi:hypothetical protein